MVFNFEPWTLDVDVDKTIELYRGHDYSVNKEYNKMFVDMLEETQKAFFEELGIDLLRIHVDKTNSRIQNEDKSIHEDEYIQMLKVDFLFCGKIIAMPENQMDLYKEEEIYGVKFDLSEVTPVTSGSNLLCYDLFGLGSGIRFKHPISHYEGSQFERWDCGFVCGALLVTY